MTRTRRVVQGFASGYVHMVVATIAGLWLTPFFLRHLGQDTFGLWLVGTQIIAYLLLMDFGVVALLPREVAYVTGRTGRRDGPELRALIERVLTVATGQTPIVLAAVAVALVCLPQGWAPLRLPLGIALGVFVAGFPLRVFQAALTGLQDLAFVARVQFAAWAVGTLINIWLVLRGYALVALAAGWCITQAIAIAASAARLATAFPGAMPRRLGRGGGADTRAYLGRSGWVSTSQVAQVLLNGTDVMVIGAVLGPAAVVPYACTSRLVAVLANQPQAILQSAAPALSELRTSAGPGRLATASSALAQATLAVSGLVACLVLALNAGFVAWWVGPGQFGGTGLTLLLVSAMLLRHFNTTNAYTLFCFGMERRLALTGLADGLVTLAASAVLVPLAGPAGAPLGAIAGVLLVSGPLNLAAVARETGVDRFHVLAALAPWFSRLAVVAVLAAGAGVWFRSAPPAALALLGGAAVMLYLAAVIAPLRRSAAGAYLAPVFAPVAALAGRWSAGRLHAATALARPEPAADPLQGPSR